jgi:hypothetical protein
MGIMGVVITVAGIMVAPTAAMVQWMTRTRKVGPAAENFRLPGIGLEPNRAGLLQASVGLAGRQFCCCSSTYENCRQKSSRVPTDEAGDAMGTGGVSKFLLPRIKLLERLIP